MSETILSASPKRVDRLGPLIGQLIQLEQVLVQGAPVEVEAFLKDGRQVVVPLSAISIAEVDGEARLRLMFMEDL